MIACKRFHEENIAARCPWCGHGVVQKLESETLFNPTWEQVPTDTLTLRGRWQECWAEGRDGIPRSELLGYLNSLADYLDRLTSYTPCVSPDIIEVRDGTATIDPEWRDLLHHGWGIALIQRYQAPEAATMLAGKEAHQFSIAIVYQEMLTGKRPFMNPTVETPNLLPLPSFDRPIVRRALSREPAQRFANCTILIEKLQGD